MCEEDSTVAYSTLIIILCFIVIGSIKYYYYNMSVYWKICLDRCSASMKITVLQIRQLKLEHVLVFDPKVSHLHVSAGVSSAYRTQSSC